MKKMITFGLIATLLLSACSKEEKEVTKPNVVSPPTIEEKETVVIPDLPKSITTGLGMKKTSTNYFGVMIENSEQARPQSGLAQADIVYEMEAEAQITRFYAIFHDEYPKKIGPVRSSRHYYLPIAESWNTPYIHFGGSTFAYEKLGNLSVPHIDGMTSSKHFERDSSRYAPHNAYLLSDRLPSFDEQPNSLPFSFGTSDKTGNITQIDIHYNYFTDISYKWDIDSGNYLRYLENEAHKDRESKKQISVANIVILYAPHKNMNTKKGHIDIDFNGEGELILYSNGLKTTGTWKNIEGTFHFYDEAGQVLEVNPGKTWIQVLDKNRNALKEISD